MRRALALAVIPLLAACGPLQSPSDEAGTGEEGLCGDGVLQDGEACDDGDANGIWGGCSDACSPLPEPGLDQATGEPHALVPLAVQGTDAFQSFTAGKPGELARVVLRSEVAPTTVAIYSVQGSEKNPNLRQLGTSVLRRDLDGGGSAYELGRGIRLTPGKRYAIRVVEQRANFVAVDDDAYPAGSLLVTGSNGTLEPIAGDFPFETWMAP